MCAISRWSVLGLLLTLAVTAPAQKVGEPAPELPYRPDDERNRERESERFAISELRGRIAVLFFFRSTNPESIDAMPILAGIQRAHRTEGVRVVLLTPEKKEKVQGTLTAQNLEEVSLFHGADISDLYQVVSYPYVFIVDPAGIITWKGHPLDDLAARVKEQIRKTPPIGADQEALTARLSRAEGLLAKGEPGRAFTLTMKVLRVTEAGSPLHERAKGLKEKLLEAGKKWLEECRSAYRDGDHKKACRIAAEVSVRFQTDAREGPEKELVAEADTEIGRLRGDLNTKDMVMKAVENARAEIKNDEAAELEANKEYLPALRLYRQVMDDFPKTEAGKAAREALERIQADPKIQALIRRERSEAQAQRWLGIAERYERVRMFAQAREQYQKIINEHPRSAAAARAKEALRKLPKDEAETTAHRDKAGG
jgi:tetratricopeptide (TPR) repeat protein